MEDPSSATGSCERGGLCEGRSSKSVRTFAVDQRPPPEHQCDVLDHLKRMCAPDLGKDEYAKVDLPSNRPNHLDAAVHYINGRIPPNLKYTPNELLLSLVVNTKPTPSAEKSGPPTGDEVEPRWLALTNSVSTDMHR